ncbi:hypothetical protein H1Q63_00540 [Desmonostoc muscorum CCALA 125]|nr:hypothetical protein [Desmonostoc muscorum CCALA 125]
MLFNLNHSKKSSIASYIQLFYQGSKQFKKSKLSNHEDVIDILSSNTSQSVYLPNVLNKTALAAELDNCQSKEISNKPLTTKSRFYWWM